jgi:hypothetical protein
MHHAISGNVVQWTFTRCGDVMHDEAEITISGVKLSDTESMTIRVAIDTLANVLAEGIEDEEARALTDRYMTALSRIQALLERREPRKQ